MNCAGMSFIIRLSVEDLVFMIWLRMPFLLRCFNILIAVTISVSVNEDSSKSFTKEMLNQMRVPKRVERSQMNRRGIKYSQGNVTHLISAVFMSITFLFRSLHGIVILYINTKHATSSLQIVNVNLLTENPQTFSSPLKTLDVALKIPT